MHSYGAVFCLDGRVAGFVIGNGECNCLSDTEIAPGLRKRFLNAAEGEGDARLHHLFGHAGVRRRRILDALQTGLLKFPYYVGAIFSRYLA